MERQLVILIPWDESENAEFAHVWLNNGKISYSFSDKPTTVAHVEVIINPYYVKPYKAPAVLKEAVHNMSKQHGTEVYYRKEITSAWASWEHGQRCGPALFDPAYSWKLHNETNNSL